MITTKPNVSIVIAYYNDKDFISECINSILGQEYKNYEVIFIDHASTDGTGDIIKKLYKNKHKHITIDRNEGAGGHHILEVALKHCEGEYIKLLPADDVMEPNCLQDLVNEIEKSNTDLVFSDMEFIDVNGINKNKKWFERHEKISEEKIIKSYFFSGVNPLPYPSSLIRKSVISNTDLCKCITQMADMYMWASILLNGGKISYLDTSLVKYRIHEGQLSSNSNAFIYSRSMFEAGFLADLFLSCKNINLLGCVFDLPECIKYNNITCEDDIFFINAYNLSKSKIYTYKLKALYKLGYLINKNHNRLINNNTFSIKEYRDLYTYEMTHKTSINDLIFILKKLIFGEKKTKIKELDVV